MRQEYGLDFHLGVSKIWEWIQQAEWAPGGRCKATPPRHRAFTNKTINKTSHRYAAVPDSLMKSSGTRWYAMVCVSVNRFL